MVWPGGDSFQFLEVSGHSFSGDDVSKISDRMLIELTLLREQLQPLILKSVHNLIHSCSLWVLPKMMLSAKYTSTLNRFMAPTIHSISRWKVTGIPSKQWGILLGRELLLPFHCCPCTTLYRTKLSNCFLTPADYTEKGSVLLIQIVHCTAVKVMVKLC